jgi:hypothetical protein
MTLEDEMLDERKEYETLSFFLSSRDSFLLLFIFFFIYLNHVNNI